MLWRQRIKWVLIIAAGINAALVLLLLEPILFEPNAANEDGPVAEVCAKFAGLLCIPLALLVGAIVLVLRRARRARMLSTNRCPSCSYDRSGLAADAACPECGKAPAFAAK